jgi:uncharacterized damage-inducible protein DinB
MQRIPMFLKELQDEAAITRKMLERVPIDKLDWKPHVKSMSLNNLAVHIAEIASWPAMALQTSELDFGKMNYKPTPINGVEDLLALHAKGLAESLSALENAKEEDLLSEWTMRTGDKIHSQQPKYEIIRVALNQTTHHRAQLGVYLRLLDIPIPGSYGPSADEMNF